MSNLRVAQSSVQCSVFYNGLSYKLSHLTLLTVKEDKGISYFHAAVTKIPEKNFKGPIRYLDPSFRGGCPLGQGGCGRAIHSMVATMEKRD